MKTILNAKAAIVRNHEIISPATITIQDGLIVHIAQETCTTADINLPQTLLFPGFVNAHCHLEYGKTIPERNFVPWIQAMLTTDWGQKKDAIKDAAYTLQTSGVTTIINHMNHPFNLSDYQDLPVRTIQFAEVVGIAEKTSKPLYEALKRNKQKTQSPFWITPHAIHSVSPSVLDEILTEQTDPFSIHIAESKEEDLYFKKKSGPMMDFLKSRLDPTDPVDPLARSAVQSIKARDKLSHRSLVVHANFIDDTDIKILSACKNICIVHCPGSFVFFHHDHFPYRQIQDSKIPLALGTDGLSSNTELNYLKEIQLFLKTCPQKDIFSLLPLLTTNALEAIGFHNIGKLQEGYAADIIGFDWPEAICPLDLLKRRHAVDFIIPSSNREF